VPDSAAANLNPASYPLTLRMQGRLAVVVGGDAVAARQVARLRAAKAEVRVVAQALSPSLAELASRALISVAKRGYLASDLDGAWLVIACAADDSVNAAVAADAERRLIWCVRADDAGASTALTPSADRAGKDMAARRVLVLGGARSGKSATAEAMLAQSGAVDYVATGYRPGTVDSEWDERVRGHQERRPKQWRTIETVDLVQVLAELGPAESGLAEPGPRAPVLIDCLATWLAQVMDDVGLWSASQGADKELALRLDRLLEAWRTTRRHVVAVSNEVGSGIVPATPSGRRFRDELGWLNARVAAASDEVWLCTAGIPQRLR